MNNIVSLYDEWTLTFPDLESERADDRAIDALLGQGIAMFETEGPIEPGDDPATYEWYSFVMDGLSAVETLVSPERRADVEAWLRSKGVTL